MKQKLIMSAGCHEEEINKFSFFGVYYAISTLILTRQVPTRYKIEAKLDGTAFSKLQSEKKFFVIVDPIR